MAKKKSPRKSAKPQRKVAKPQRKATKKAAKKPQKTSVTPQPVLQPSQVCADSSCRSRGGLAFVGCMFLGMGLGSMAGATGVGTLLGMGAGFLVMKRCNTDGCN